MTDTAKHTKPTQEIARENELTLYRLLHKFGYLTNSQIAALRYPEARQGLRLAQRLVKRLVDARMLLRSDGGFGGQDYIGLSAAGARFLSGKSGSRVESAKDVLRDPSRHRDAANWSAIHLLNEGWPQVWTEREIQTFRAPFHELTHKVPDVLASDMEGYVVWGEIEASARGGRDLQKVASWLLHAAFPDTNQMTCLDLPRETLWLSRVRFVIAAPEAQTFPGRLGRQLARMQGRGFEPGRWDNQVEFQYLDAPQEIRHGFRNL